MPIELTKKQKFYITLFNIIVPFLVGMAVDLYIPSIPHIANAFNVSQASVQLTISLYMLGFGIGQLFLGILSDSIGRRRIFLGSISFFTVASFIAAISPNIFILNLCRFLQGLGVAGMNVSRRAIAIDCFAGFELTKAMTLIATSWALGPIVGPYIGGYLQHYFSWHADFYFFGLYGLFILVITYFTLPETSTYKQQLNIKTISSAITTIMTTPAFVIGTILLSLIYSLLVIFNTISPFLVQNTMHYSVVAYGRIALFMGFGYFSGTFLNRYMVKFFTPLEVVHIGLYLALIALLGMLILAITVTLNLYIVIVPTFIAFLSCGWIFPNLMSKCMGLFPQIAGTASAIFGTMVAVGVFLMSTFATILNTTTQLPMTLTYLAMIAVCIILFYACKGKFVGSDRHN